MPRPNLTNTIKHQAANFTQIFRSMSDILKQIINTIENDAFGLTKDVLANFAEILQDANLQDGEIEEILAELLDENTKDQENEMQNNPQNNEKEKIEKYIQILAHLAQLQNKMQQNLQQSQLQMMGQMTGFLAALMSKIILRLDMLIKSNPLVLQNLAQILQSLKMPQNSINAINQLGNIALTQNASLQNARNHLHEANKPIKSIPMDQITNLLASITNKQNAAMLDDDDIGDDFLLNAAPTSANKNSFANFDVVTIITSLVVSAIIGATQAVEAYTKIAEKVVANTVKATVNDQQKLEQHKKDLNKAPEQKAVPHQQEKHGDGCSCCAHKNLGKSAASNLIEKQKENIDKHQHIVGVGAAPEHIKERVI